MVSRKIHCYSCEGMARNAGPSMLNAVYSHEAFTRLNVHVEGGVGRVSSPTLSHNLVQSSPPPPLFAHTLSYRLLFVMLYLSNYEVSINLMEWTLLCGNGGAYGLNLCTEKHFGALWSCTAEFLNFKSSCFPAQLCVDLVLETRTRDLQK